jgi:mRNA interferase HicA
MKKRDLEKRLRDAGWWFLRQGSNHEIWTNGELAEPIPRHKEIHEQLAGGIIRFVRENPPKERS